MADEKRDEPAREKQVPDNSDPTGIGPPPPGAETQVKDGQGVAQAPSVGSHADTRKQPEAS